MVQKRLEGEGKKEGKGEELEEKSEREEGEMEGEREGRERGTEGVWREQDYTRRCPHTLVKVLES